MSEKVGSGELYDPTRRVEWSWLHTLLSGVAVLLVAALSISRILALILYYRAPYQVYAQLHHHIPSSPLTSSSSSYSPTYTSVCVGKEWYRFPTHFYLPPSYRLRFLKSSFTGLLPDHYLQSPSTDVDRTVGTSVIPFHQNDMNREQVERYVSDLSECDWIVDWELEEQEEGKYSEMRVQVKDEEGKEIKGEEWRWEVVYEAEFLEAKSSTQFSRALFVPGWSREHNVYRPYRLMKKTKVPAS